MKKKINEKQKTCEDWRKWLVATSRKKKIKKSRKFQRNEKLCFSFNDDINDKHNDANK